MANYAIKKLVAIKPNIVEKNPLFQEFSFFTPDYFLSID